MLRAICKLIHRGISIPKTRKENKSKHNSPHIYNLHRMASFSSKNFILLYFVSIFANSLKISKAGDPDITSDFIVPQNIGEVDGDFFTFTGTRGIVDSSIPKFKVTKAGKAEFSALDGQSVSMSVLQFPPNAVNSPHIHPRSAELMFVIKGRLEVGFIDSTDKLFTQSLQTGDMFVFPKGLVHYQYNNHHQAATAISAFGSVNAGTVSIPTTLFGSGVDDAVLVKSFKTDASNIQKIKAGFASKA